MSETPATPPVVAAAAPVIPAVAPVAAAPATPSPAPAAAAPERRKSALGAEPAAAPAAAAPAPAAAGAAKPAEAAAPAAVPEKYEFTMPEGVQLDTGLLDKTTPILKELGLSQEQANKLVGAYSEHIASINSQHEVAQIEAHNKQIDAWDGDLKKQYGDKLPQVLTDAQTALKQLDSPDLVNLLESSGYGSHPGVIAALARLGTQMRERETVIGGASPQQNDWGFGNR